MNNHSELKRKLSSRKLWSAIIGFVTALLVAFKVDNLAIEQVISIVSAMSVLIAYIVGEGLVDSARINSNHGDSID